MTQSHGPNQDGLVGQDTSIVVDAARPELRSTILRRGMIWASGVASTVLFALGAQLFATAWSGYQAIGWVLVVTLALGVIGWWFSTSAERARLRELRRLTTAVPGPAAPVRPNWLPAAGDDVSPADVDEILAVFGGETFADLARFAPNEQMKLAEAVARHMLDPAASWPTAERAAHFDLHGLDSQNSDGAQHAVAGVLFAAFGMETPDCSDTSLARASGKLVDVLREPTTLVVLSNVSTDASFEWLTNGALPSTGPPWLIVVRQEDDDRVLDASTLETEAKDLLCAVARLPRSELDADALSAVHAAVSPNAIRTLLQLLGELCNAKFLECSRDSARYRVRPEGHAAAGKLALTNARTEAALPALLNHYATQCQRWGTALRTAASAATAAQWFRTEQHVLHALVTSTKQQPDDLVIDPLVQICDALDVWYARQRMPARLQIVSQTLGGIMNPDALRMHHALAEIRQHAAGRQLETSAEMPVLPRVRHPLWPAVLARHHHEQGLTHLACAVALERTAERNRFDDAFRSLRAAWLALPRADVDGQIAVAVNLGVVHIHQGQLDRAMNCLNLALSLTRKRGDASSEAHIRELAGVAAWAGGQRHRAVELWRKSVGLYRTLEEAHGESRCLQHLGTAVLSDPDLARLIPVESDGPVHNIDEMVALQRARSWLERSIQLRPDQPDERSLAARYLDELRSRLPPDDSHGGNRQPHAPDDHERQRSPTVVEILKRWFKRGAD